MSADNGDEPTMSVITPFASNVMFTSVFPQLQAPRSGLQAATHGTGRGAGYGVGGGPGEPEGVGPSSRVNRPRWRHVGWSADGGVCWWLNSGGMVRKVICLLLAVMGCSDTP